MADSVSSFEPSSTQLPPYAELHCLSSFSFQRGASQPAELVERAAELGYQALAITDECSLAGVVRAYAKLQKLKEQRARDRAAALDPSGYAISSASPGNDGALGLPKLIIGSEFAVDLSTLFGADSPAAPWTLIALARNRAGYGQLSRFITRLRRSSTEKGSYRLAADQFDGDGDDDEAGNLPDCAMLLAPARACSATELQAGVAWARGRFAGRLWLAVELLLSLDDAAWLRRLREVGGQLNVPLVAAGDVQMHVRSRKPLHDVITAIRQGRPVAECGLALQPHAERHLRSRLRLTQLYPPDLLAATIDVADSCHFSLGELRYEYPDEVVPPMHSAGSYLRQVTLEGLQRRYPQGAPPAVAKQIEHELSLIAEMGFEKYFLTVYDIVNFARSQKILCQGRGSAANSAVCYSLGITEVDPSCSNLLFERFISRERNEPPDIDVDFEHQRREEVIQYLYKKYGRDRTALAATVITYRTRSAVRDVGKALGFGLDVVDAMAKSHQWWESRAELIDRMVELGLDAHDPRIQQWLVLTEQLIGFPRHLSQHVGGFVIAKGLLSELVPIENAAMVDRSVIQWDKDDLESLCLMKVDVLALGMLSAIRRSLELIGRRRGQPSFSMQDIPREDRATYAMIQRADTIGVFQIESRAQMSMLPRLRPERFYDLVVQVAIVRPGPIEGGMVHPYLKSREARRQDPAWEPSYPKILHRALSRTLGVPIFQEQVMQIVIDGAGFTPGEADQLRRAMAAWKRKGGLEPFQHRIVEGLTLSTKDRDFAVRIFEMIKGFGEYGFPESHAASFAWLAYVSSWIKRYEPAAFLVGLLNSLPMGFYSANQLVQDARRHDVEVRPVDVVHSFEQSTLEDRSNQPPDAQPAVRLGLDHVASLGAAAALRIVAARRERPYANVEDLARRAQLGQPELRALASADALASLAGHRRQQVWQASALHAPPVLLREAPVHEPELLLPPAPEGEEIVFDYAATRLTLRRHPLALLRPWLTKRRLLSAEVLHADPNRRLARACGIVTMRQQPQTAKGTIFLSLEDETGSVNVIVWPSLRDRQRSVLLNARLMAVFGRWQSQNGVSHLVAQHLVDLTPALGRLGTTSRDFH